MSDGAAKVEAAPPAALSQPSIYLKPSLPYLLSQYGFEDKEASELRKRKEEKRRQKKLLRKQAKKSDSFNSDDDDEKDQEREREREEHYEQMVRDLHRLRDYYYKEYTGMLAEKVEKQRKQQRDRDAEIMKRRLKEEEEERKASHRVKKRLERHTLETTPVTDDVPKTDLYHIIGLENKLRREGKLKTMTDYNKFREALAQPRIFNHYFNKSALKSYISNDNASSHRDSSEVFSLAPEPELDELLTGHKHPRSLSRISEGYEASRPGTRTEGWAITQQYPAIYKSRKSVGNIGKQKSDYKQDLDKRFPKLEMPKLHCFTMNLAKKPPDPEEVRQQMELRAKEKQRKRAVRTYTKMYQLAMSNAAASARIFDMHEDMSMLLDGPELCDVIADNHWMEAYGLTELPPQDDDDEEEEDHHDMTQESPASPAWSSHQPLPDIEECQAIEPPPDTSQETGDSHDDLQQKPSSQSSRKSSSKSKKSAAVEKSPSPLPLTMEEIQGDCNVKEAKTLSTLWTNYLQAGKPRS